MPSRSGFRSHARMAVRTFQQSLEKISIAHGASDAATMFPIPVKDLFDHGLSSRRPKRRPVTVINSTIIFLSARVADVLKNP